MRVQNYEFRSASLRGHYRRIACNLTLPLSMVELSHQLKGIGISSRASIFKAGYNQLGGNCRAGLYTNFVDKQVLSTFCVPNNKLGHFARYELSEMQF
jgi:hypothetical protein